MVKVEGITRKRKENRPFPGRSSLFNINVMTSRNSCSERLLLLFSEPGISAGEWILRHLPSIHWEKKCPHIAICIHYSDVMLRASSDRTNSQSCISLSREDSLVSARRVTNVLFVGRTVRGRCTWICIETCHVRSFAESNSSSDVGGFFFRRGPCNDALIVCVSGLTCKIQAHGSFSLFILTFWLNCRLTLSFPKQRKDDYTSNFSHQLYISL